MRDAGVRPVLFYLMGSESLVSIIESEIVDQCGPIALREKSREGVWAAFAELVEPAVLSGVAIRVYGFGDDAIMAGYVDISSVVRLHGGPGGNEVVGTFSKGLWHPSDRAPDVFGSPEAGTFFSSARVGYKARMKNRCILERDEIR
jgi:hypothetical protein